MSDYITNSKNRKLKTKIDLFFSRINIGMGKLPLSGMTILVFEVLLLISLFLPWIRIADFNDTKAYGAFSGYTAYIGIGIILGLILVPFFLLSHTKKERIRAKIPFRLSDAQAVVFVSSLILTGIVHIFIITRAVYNTQIATHWATLESGFTLALTSSICIIIAAYFFSRENKTLNTELYYLDHQTEDELSEYRDIINTKEEKEKKNMSLPI